jgi:hypothetical protein
MWNSAGQKDMKVKGGEREGEKGEGAEDKRRYQRGEYDQRTLYTL